MAKITTQQVIEKFDVQVNDEWSFEETKSTEQFTHGYHRYPAKFIPQIVKKLIESYTVEGDKIVDVFAGCGTTLVESKLHGRRSEGVDINPVAELITKAKIHAILPSKVENRYTRIALDLQQYDGRRNYSEKYHSRIDYWFKKSQKNKIAFLYKIVLRTKDKQVRDFFLCALSNILKSCSRWLQTSTKPQVDPQKEIHDPFGAFHSQVKKMLKRNGEFYRELESKKLLNTKCLIKLADARRTKIRKNSADAIITSPPYVTSYEYADIHQLTGYWFEYISDIISFRRNFIGTFYSNNKETKTIVPIAKDIVSALSKKNVKNAREVANYFNDMHHVVEEMHRILKPGGVVCLVVGNTTLRDVRIKSAEVFAQMLAKEGLKIQEVIKRKIPFKIIPTIRDKKTGKFTTLNNVNKKLVYPEEFIIVAKKPLIKTKT